MSQRAHRSNYKNLGKTTQEMRLRRGEVTISLRKNKREETIEKRRDIAMKDIADANDVKMNIECNGLDAASMEQEFAAAMADAFDPKKRYEALQNIRHMVSANTNPPLNILVNADLLSILVECIKWQSDDALKFEATWILTNIASGTSEQTHKVVEAGAMPRLLQLLKSPEPQICEQAVWALGNIIGDGPYLCNMAIEYGFVPLVLSLINDQLADSFLHNITWTLVNLCRHRSDSITIEVATAILPYLGSLIVHHNEDIKVDALWALCYLAEVGKEHINLIIKNGIIEKTVPLLMYPADKIQTAALRTLGNIITGTDEQTQVVLDQNALQYFPALLEHQAHAIRKEALWFLSNVAAGNNLQKQTIFDNNLVAPMIRLLANDSFVIQKEAAWVISNITAAGVQEQVLALIQAGVIAPFCNLLSCQDVQLLDVVLSGLKNMLDLAGMHVVHVANLIEQCGGLDKIENLQAHENALIYNLAFHIIDQYFTDNDEQVEAQLQPVVIESEFSMSLDNLPPTYQFRF